MNSSKKTGAFQPQTLDVDETIFDKNLKIIDDNELDDNISGLFPGMTKNENASAAQKYKMQRKLLPQDEYPTVQVCEIHEGQNLPYTSQLKIALTKHEIRILGYFF